ncbi:MAG: hypothetical protein KDA78_07675, partial [Planctomycetaceae bacterium]|nr:hypothetical protein [Planctomycetaceae bacterium]
VLIDDTEDDALTEGLDPLNDPLVADIFVSEGPVFYFDVETDATISITNLEIEVGEEEDGGAVATTIDDQRVFFFENAAGPTDITISNNFIVINDLGSAGINGFLTLVNDILVTEFDAASGDITLNSPQTNTVIVVPPGLPLTNPALLFDGPATGNFTGQLDFNGVFVP